MSNRKPATASRHARVPKKKVAQKAQRAAQAVVRSQKATHAIGTGSTKPSPGRHNDSDQEALLVDNPRAQNDCKQTMTDGDSKKRTNFSLATADVGTYQAKLLEMAQANTQFAFEFAQRLVTIKSPLEFPSIIAEFTSKRIAMFRKIFERNG